jgi:hypothetical protein
MMRFRSLVLLLTLAAACSGRGAAPAAPRAAAGPQTVVLVSLDGFRPDYLDRPGAVNLRALAAEGVRARAMEPVFPTKTFPNHYSLVTGLHPARSGIISNTMEDPELGRFAISDTNAVRDARWWGGEPFWVTVERQGLRAAAFFWPGSEAAIDGIRPTWYERFDDSVPFDTRVRRVLSWLRLPADSAPRFITLLQRVGWGRAPVRPRRPPDRFGHRPGGQRHRRAPGRHPADGRARARGERHRRVGSRNGPGQPGPAGVP